MRNKTYFSFDDTGNLQTMRGRSRYATAKGFHNSPQRAVDGAIDDLIDMNRDGVRKVAQAMRIKGRSKMTKPVLIEAIGKQLRTVV